ncbi:MAG: DEAD/DEAH box helicase [Phycisphaerales bacterium]|jgi:ATP-dependent RNA helicase RhlE|nr:DEAD/DEAH box helicase [Phycisphaerales bacterium]
MSEVEKQSEKPVAPSENPRSMVIDAFNELPIAPVVLHGIEELGFEAPTPIQQRIIGPLVAGRDAIGLAPTGTGKTLAYGIPLAHQLIANPPPLSRRVKKRKGGDAGAKYVDPRRRLRGLVVVPTRELAQQVAEEIRRLTRGSLVKVTAVWGKAAVKPQRERIEAGVDVVVGTPGRLRELMDIDVLSLAFIRHLVIDEGDRMLDMGFLPQVKTILERMPETRQMAFFSATMPPAMENLARTFLRNPQRVEIGRHTRVAETVGNHMYEIDDVLKVALLLHLVVEEKRRGVIIFCRTRRRAGWVNAAFRNHGISVGLIHGDKSQNQRMRALEQFSEGSHAVLVATDVASRGLHIPTVRTVVNYDLPLAAEEWVHRVGRAGHGGGFAESFTFVSPPDGQRWKKIAKIVGQRLRADPVPDIEKYIRPQDVTRLERLRSGERAVRFEPFREDRDGRRGADSKRGVRSSTRNEPRGTGAVSAKKAKLLRDEFGLEVPSENPPEKSAKSKTPRKTGGKRSAAGSAGTGTAGGRKPRGSGSGGASGAKSKTDGRTGGKNAARKTRARSGDRIGHGGRRKGATKPVSKSEKPGGGVRRPS